MDPAAEHRQQLRSLRDFLLVYNRMTELCFRHCVCGLNYRLLTGPEESCLDSCAARLVRANHRLMSAYVGLMPALLQRRAAEHGAPTPEHGAPTPEHGAPAPEHGVPAAEHGAPTPERPSPEAPGAGT